MALQLNEESMINDKNQLESFDIKINSSVEDRSTIKSTKMWWSGISIIVVTFVAAIVLMSTILVLNRKTNAITTTTKILRTAMSEKYYKSSFRMMTYNIRFDTDRDGINQWAFRKDRVANLIRYHAADLFGVQEALPNQMFDLKNALPGFEWYGAGRDDGKDKGEFSAVFYRSERFELLDKNTFWLSETPELPGIKGWDADVTRVCSWVKLRDRYTNQILYHFNTHFDHVGEIARRESAHLIVDRIYNITKFQAPVILTGDFNTGPDSDPYRAIIANSSLEDAKDLTEIPHYGPNSTWSTFFVGQELGDRIDYIFVTPQYVRVLQHAVLTDSNAQHYPSDHFPVLAELSIKT